MLASYGGLTEVHELFCDAVPDPFEDGEDVAEAAQKRNTTRVIEHNVADVRRTRELANVVLEVSGQGAREYATSYF